MQLQAFRNSRPCSAAGFSLIELMIAMALGLVLMLGLAKILLSNNTTYSTQEGLSLLQDNARFAAHQIKHDAVMAGFMGCLAPAPDSTRFSNTLNPPDSYAHAYAIPISGVDDSQGGPGSDVPAFTTSHALDAHSDVLTLRTPLGYATTLKNDMENATDTVLDVVDDPVDAVHSGDLMMISSCTRGTSLFKVKSVSSGSIAIEANDLGRKFDRGAELQQIAAVTYFIAPSEYGDVQSLWRQVGTQNAQELIPGVDSMQVEYNDGEGYQPAGNNTHWDEIKSLRVYLLLNSVDPINDPEMQQSSTVQLSDTQINPPNDRRLRQKMTITVALRNRMH